MQTTSDVLIVGAGLAGLAAARQLTRVGFSVRVLEKSRGVSGRAATKRLANGAISDSGAPFFTVRSELTRAFVQSLEHRGVVKIWQYGMKNWKAGTISSSPDGHPRYVAPNGISTLGKALRDGESGEPTLEIVQNALVSTVLRHNLGYQAVLDNGDIYTARAVLVNAPAPQALSLTRPILEPPTQIALEQVKFAPCWALIIALEEAPTVDWQALRLEHPILSWVSLEHTKRGGAPVLLVHANAAWSEAHLEQPSQAVTALILKATEDVFGNPLETEEIIAHRWRYANAVVPYLGAYLQQDNLVFCGDWCSPNGSARIESALESGWAAAGALAKQLEPFLTPV